MSHPHFAATNGLGIVTDTVDLSALGDSGVSDLKRTLATHGVMVFRNQTLTDEDFVGFLSRLGEMTFTPGEIPLPHFPMLNLISNVGRTTPPRSVFHTDSSYFPKPPAFTALRAVTVPKAGGATLFSDQYEAAERLPERWKACLKDRTVLHGVSGLEGQDETNRHPLFRRHPISGREALFLSTPKRCSAISGFSQDESRRIVDILYKRSIRPSRLFKHEWREGDVVVWDDRCTMHKADHSQTVGDRVLHRGMVAGEAPIPAH